jgi:hypothetical protein
MRKLFIGILSFCISFTIGYQFARISGSQIPFHGEAFVGDSVRNGLIYFSTYFFACLYFAIKYSHSQKTKYIIRLLCFFGMTSLIGFVINRYILYWEPLTQGVWQ